ncbi:MAG: putative 7-carboxy-7-deazaguanine synthase QueE [Fusobacteriaceae bacterium]|nr:putative 7-carboxy-7-deazaguanine synthase QueE [Fusobacteriaceae bacterium]
MKVVEKFISINGEGKKAGELAIFIRFKGCNLDCIYCDTKWANLKNEEYEELTKEEIYNFIKNVGVKNVTITGGEPLLQEGIYELLEYISKDKEISIEIETNGSVDISKFKRISDRISFTVDYKTNYSKMESFMNLENFDYVNKNDVVKFVVGEKSDLDKVLEMMKIFELREKTNVFVSPVFEKINPIDIVNWQIKNRLNEVKLQIQMHKIIWHPDKKGV